MREKYPIPFLFSANGMGWIVPAVMGCLIGFIIKKIKMKKGERDV